MYVENTIIQNMKYFVKSIYNMSLTYFLYDFLVVINYCPIYLTDVVD